jgi:hypothetical protein
MVNQIDSRLGGSCAQVVDPNDFRMPCLLMPGAAG